MDQAIIFGQFDHLVGIANIIETNLAKDTAMIFMTAGMLHNIGPYRMYVDIARSLEQQGISSLRFDISGIGDSLGVGTAGKSIDRAASEACEAMDYLENNHGIKQFILYGLCSGADDSIQTALKDERVKGVIALDGLSYPTFKFKLNRLALLPAKLFKLDKWQKKLKISKMKKSAPASLAKGSDIREHPETPKKAAEELQALVDRGTFLHFIYTGGLGSYNYAGQFYDMLPDMRWKGTESTHFFSHMDHIVTLCEDRKELVNHVTKKTLEMISANA